MSLSSVIPAESLSYVFAYLKTASAAQESMTCGDMLKALVRPFRATVVLSDPKLKSVIGLLIAHQAKISPNSTPSAEPVSPSTAPVPPSAAPVSTSSAVPPSSPVSPPPPVQKVKPGWGDDSEDDDSKYDDSKDSVPPHQAMGGSVEIPDMKKVGGTSKTRSDDTHNEPSSFHKSGGSASKSSLNAPKVSSEAKKESGYDRLLRENGELRKSMAAQKVAHEQALAAKDALFAAQKETHRKILAGKDRKITDLQISAATLDGALAVYTGRALFPQPSADEHHYEEHPRAEQAPYANTQDCSKGERCRKPGCTYVHPSSHKPV